MSYTPAKHSPAAAPTTSQSNDLVGLIKQLEPQIKLALPKHLDAGRFTRILLTEIRKTPALQQCDRASFLGAMMQSAQLGLEPGSSLGLCYLIPYKTEVQFIIGYQGQIELVERDGRVTVDAHVIYERDEFDFTLGLDASIHHKPYFGPEDPGQVVGSYAVARYNDGRYKFRVCSRREIEAARARSKSGKSNYSPWATDYAEMARKTAVRRLFKLLPKSPEMARIQALEDQLEAGESQDFSDVLVDVPHVAIGTPEPTVQNE